MKELLFKRKTRFILYFIACFLPIISDLLQTLVFAKFFGAIEIGTMDAFKRAAIFALFVIIISFCLYITSRMMRISFMRDTILDVRIAAFDKILNSSYKHFSKKSKDVYISNLINDINNFENNFFINLLNFIYRAGYYIVAIAIIAYYDYLLGIVMFASSIIIFLVSRAFEQRTIKLQKDVSTASENFTVNTANTFNGLEILKLNNIEKKFISKNIDEINKVERSKYRFRFLTDSQRSLSFTLSFSITIGILMYLLYRVNQGLGYDKLMLLVQLSSSIAFSLQDIFPRFNVIKSSAKIYDKITKSEEENYVNNKKNQFSFAKEIDVKNLTFSYEGKEIFNDVSFKIEKGKKYLIKGPSGVGKSTLIKILSLIYDNYEGEINVDGISYKTIKEKTFNDKVAYIYQDVFLFEDSIKNNITLFKDMDEELIMNAAQKAGLTDFLVNKEQGLDELVSENGKNLSGGERQRISIARAIAKNAEILFIDEGTSALNEELGKQVEETFLKLNHTVVSISHRYYKGVTDQYDYVLEIKNGKINTFTGKDFFAEEAKYA